MLKKKYDKLIFKYNEVEGIISKKGEFKPKCDKLNMTLSQI